MLGAFPMKWVLLATSRCWRGRRGQIHLHRDVAVAARGRPAAGGQRSHKQDGRQRVQAGDGAALTALYSRTGTVMFSALP